MSKGESMEWTITDAVLILQGDAWFGQDLWMARAEDHCGRTLVCRVPSSLGPEAAERGVLALIGKDRY